MEGDVLLVFQYIGEPAYDALWRSTFICLWNAEARKQVQMMTERMGGEYSPDLHVNCTHLVVQISFWASHLRALWWTHLVIFVKEA